VTQQSAFGEDAFGRYAEGAARFFGTPQYIVGQTILVALWITLNAVGLSQHWDPYPFILLNLVFSTQAAYAAPLILLAQTRQADRDKIAAEKDQKHRDSVIHHLTERENLVKRQNDDLRKLIQANTDLTQQDKDLTESIAAMAREIHAAVRPG
jgi:uncharacterized membrane protein